MLFDHCTWDDDYKKITLKIRSQLLKLAHAAQPEYTVVLMQGSGTFGVESVITSVIGKSDKLLIAANGAYGERMADIAAHAGIPYVLYREEYDKVPSAKIIKKIMKEDPEITHVSMVHSETTSGILNDIESVGKVVKDMGRTFIVDAMSSFGGVDIPVGEWGIDFLVSSANKCIQGVPGFSFIICRTDKLIDSSGKARSLSLDLYDQWLTMNKDGKWRFTSPTHVVLAFAKALEELEEEEQRKDERRGDYYGKDTFKNSNKKKRHNIYIFSLEDLDNDDIISMVETTPTFQRTKTVLESIQSKAIAEEEETFNNDAENGGITITF